VKLVALVLRPTAMLMTSAELRRRVRNVVGHLPLCPMSDLQRREFDRGTGRA
jgi:hypothetical protein